MHIQYICIDYIIYKINIMHVYINISVDITKNCLFNFASSLNNIHYGYSLLKENCFVSTYLLFLRNNCLVSKLIYTKKLKSLCCQYPLICTVNMMIQNPLRKVHFSNLTNFLFLQSNLPISSSMVLEHHILFSLFLKVDNYTIKLDNDLCVTQLKQLKS